MATGIPRFTFSKNSVTAWKAVDEKHVNWPAVYVLDDGATQPTPGRPRDIYVGESLNLASRLRQHLETPSKQHLRHFRPIIRDMFNKSVCLDLESYLIKMMAGDGANCVLNRNNGITETNYYQCEMYRDGFPLIFEQLRHEGLFTRTIPEIENSDLYKLSPFKALTEDQADSIEEIVNGLLSDLGSGTASTTVIQGDPGTGKTVAAIYLIKLLRDIGSFTTLEDLDTDLRFSEFFTLANRDLLRDCRIAFVIPQQSLRASVKKVFKTTPGLDPSMVLTPFNVGEDPGRFDLILVDETHRLSQRASQPSGPQNKKFSAITTALFGTDDLLKTQLHWIQAKSTHGLFLVDTEQSVLPADLPTEHLSALIARARAAERHFTLRTQMRVRAGADFVAYIRWILHPSPTHAPPAIRDFGDYDFRLFDNVARMRAEIFQRDAEVGLARMAAGFAWEWKSRKKENRGLYDIEIGGLRMRWNSATDWIASGGALEEVGSIHTVQGYDLNYVGVIVGRDLKFDPERGRLYVDRAEYFDKRGKQNNPTLGVTYTDEDLLRFITQIYKVLLTRGVKGTYVYACDEAMREYLARFIPRSHDWGAMVVDE